MDEQKNLVKGMASLLAGSGVVEVSGTDKNETGNWSEESDGVYTTTRTAKIAGDRHYATLKLSTWSSATIRCVCHPRSGSRAGLFLHRYRQNDLHRGRCDKSYGDTQG